MQESKEEKVYISKIASDRNVLNLPGIGKSMTFKMVGIMPDGCRLLEFKHDQKRKHSPIINNNDKVYIKENKSLYEYMIQLQDIGEDPQIYGSIWEYTEGETESRNPFFLYPELDYNMTKKYNNIIIEK